MRTIFIGLLCASAWGQSLITITGPLKMADSSGWNGKFTVSWPAMLCGSTPVRKGSKTVTVVNGVVPTLQVYATASCGDNRYTVDYDGGTKAWWTIPTTPSSQTVASVEQLTQPALPVIPPFAIGQVSGLQATLDTLALLIPGTAVSSVFGRTGPVVATTGDYTTAQVTESGNLYLTDARVRAAITATSPLVMTNGVLSCATCGTGAVTAAGTGLLLGGSTMSADTSVIPLYGTGAGVPSGACNGVRLYLRDDNTAYSCLNDVWTELGAALPVASGSVLGGIKIGSGLSIDGSGVVSASVAGGATWDSLVSVTWNAI